MDLDLIAVTVSWEYRTCGMKTYIEKPIPKISNLKFSCDVRSPVESLEKTSGRQSGHNL